MRLIVLLFISYCLFGFIEARYFGGFGRSFRRGFGRRIGRGIRSVRRAYSHLGDFPQTGNPFVDLSALLINEIAKAAHKKR